jgi:type I restriction enzyme M protein
MNNEQFKNLKDRLWEGADQLRANSGLKATEYATPILGLIFLRFAQSKYVQFEDAISAEYKKNKGTRGDRKIHEIAVQKCGFYLPPEAKFDYLLNLPESENLAEKTKTAMEEIEKYTAELADTLPKDAYYNVNSADDPQVLAKLFKVFKDIPTDVSLDIFGEIYEYFLGKFALAEGQSGGEFFTPSSVVRYMVETLAPTDGEIFDPACGSGGMFVQTAHYIARHGAKGKNSNLRAYGVEKIGATVKLAKMNLVLNNVRGSITEANSYYRDPYDCFGRFHYVMANPPFNVDEVELDQVKPQPRFNTYGVPQNKTKKTKGSAKETVPNANYLWINLFATSLNEKGRAALVMANSASDAGGSEKDIRIKLIESGVISQMVTLPTNMFSSVTLPATLWFFDKGKPRKDEILFIDARNVFTQIDRAHRKFSDEQIKNLAVITRLYEGKNDEFAALIEEYRAALAAAPETSSDEDVKPKAYWLEQIEWLTSRFPDGKYADVTGLCKAAKLDGEDGIRDQDYSLNPGRYVGVVIEDDGMSEEEFKEEMRGLDAELAKLNAEARELEKTIADNLRLLVGGEKRGVNDEQ